MKSNQHNEKMCVGIATIGLHNAWKYGLQRTGGIRRIYIWRRSHCVANIKCSHDTVVKAMYCHKNHIDCEKAVSYFFSE